MAYSNLPGAVPTLEDGNLIVSAENDNPIVIIFGTAAKGDATIVYDVNSPSEASSAYGRSQGTLIRGMYEAYQGGARAMKLVRVGSKAATLTPVGTGITIETLERDDLAGHNYSIFFDDTIGRLRIWRVSDDELVYDNNPAYPTGAVDEHAVAVTGSWTTGSGNIGSLTVPLTLVGADGEGGATYTAGSDGIQLSRMELWEALYEAYEMVENEDMDILIPQDVYLDDSSVGDMTTAQVATLNTTPPWSGSPTTYPTRGTTYDALGEVFVQEYQGQFYFWWDMDRDGQAEIYPSAGSSGATSDAYGNALTAGDFHEVNFAYQLANFCYTITEEEITTTGVIGVKPPSSWAPKHISDWIGRIPTYAADSSDNLVITANGEGLLGNRWMAGRLGSAVSGLPDHTVGGIAALSYGGFIATDDGFIDGTQQYDDNDHLIDIGKYIDVVGGYAIFSNATSNNSYMGSGATQYGGFRTTLQSSSAPTNKVVPGIRLPFRIRNSKLDSLAGMRYVFFKNARKGPVVADAPTAARPDSDYQRRMTMDIVKDVIEAVRAKAEPFFGEGALSSVKIIGLDTAIESALSSFVPSHLERYEKRLTYTPSQKIQGEATLRLLLVTVSELRTLLINVALSES
jgi:hypothetical protein